MMGKILFILLLVLCLGDAGLANYPAWKEGDDAYLSFSLPNDAKRIQKGRLIIIDLGGAFPETFNNSYKERVIYDKKEWRRRGLFNFTLLNVTSSDAGTFQCRNYSPIPKCSQVLVVARHPSEPKVECSPEPLVEGYEVTLTCKSSSKSLPQDYGLIMNYRWRKNNKNLTTQHANDGNLTFTVRRTDRGDNYSCQAFEGGMDSQWSSNFTLHPQYGPDLIRISPTSVLEGDQVTCSADCNPGCNITWSGGDVQVTTGQVLFSIDRTQSGIYCTAWNVHGNKSMSVDVKVLSLVDATVVIMVVNIIIVLVLILLTSGLISYRGRKRTGLR